MAEQPHLQFKTKMINKRGSAWIWILIVIVLIIIGIIAYFIFSGNGGGSGLFGGGSIPQPPALPN